MTDLPTPFAWPIVVIDFEATALSHESYPIEVGIAVMANAAAPIVTWSTLIQPAPGWDMTAQWDPDAENIHGIRRWSLRGGMAAIDVMQELNVRVPNGAAVWCDGGQYDVAWLRTLAAAAGVDPTFELYDLGAAMRRDSSLHARYLAARRGKPLHRAGADAERICGALFTANMRR